MSDTTITPKTPLWKQLLGAIAGALAAFILYQGYTFTADHIAAVTTGGPRAGVLWPSATASFPNETIDPDASSPSAPGRMRSVVGTGDAPAAMQNEAVVEQQPAVIGDSSAATNSIAMEVAPPMEEQAPVEAEPSASDLDVPVEETMVVESAPIPESEPLPITAQNPFAAPTMADSATMANNQGTSLPQSGFGIDVVAVMTIGAILGKRKMARRTL